MRKNGEVRLVDLDAEEQLFTTRDAAAFLGYHHISVLRLVQQKRLKWSSRAGRVLLFKRSELERYQARRAAAGAGRFLPNPPARPQKVLMSATLSRCFAGRWRVVRRLRSFRWEDMPLLLRRRGKAAPGRASRISVRYSDGRELIMDCRSDACRQTDYWLVG